MSRFFFHLVSPGEVSRDDTGSEFPNVEEAYLDAHRAAVEMSCDLLRQRQDPYRYQFEITDADGRFLMDLPFAEVAQAKSVPPPGLHADLRRKLERCRALKSELADEFEQTREALKATRAAVDLSRRQR